MVFIDIRLHRFAFVLRQNIMQHQACHLVRSLSTRRHKATFRARAGSTVANRKDFRVARGLQRWLRHQLVNAVRFQTTDIFHKIRRFDTCRPDHQIRFDVLAVFGVQTAFVGAGHHRLCQHPHTQFGEFIVRRTGDTRRQRREDAFTGFDQRDVQRVVC